MPIKSRSVIHVKKTLAKLHKIPIRIGAIIIVTLITSICTIPHFNDVGATSCPDLKVIFARGSGGKRYESGHYLAFKSSMEQKLKTTNLNYSFDDLDYPAVSIGISDGHLGTLLGAYIGGGDAYDFGDSVHQGTKELLNVVNNDPCNDTKYVFAGYSQGNLVLLNELDKINPNKIIYIATFGDPKLYLPEGAGPVPAACSGKNLSNYRIYVPDCRAYKGLLGARKPYFAPSFEGKVGTWCNKGDVLCSSHFSIRDHTHYAEDGLYEDASRFIFSKIAKTFNITNQYSSPHDTAILIDSTGSMNELVEKYKDEAKKLAEKTFSTGGRVALYDYRDLGDGYVPVERCSFETCTDLDRFDRKLQEIKFEGGGDDPESLLSASIHVMRSLEWKFGSTKSLVILTDAGYHSPDLAGTTFYDVKKLSQQIDPVNFYIVTDKKYASEYQSLAEATDGAVVSTVDELNLLTDKIIDRFDSLPRVEEEFVDEQYDAFIPTLEINEITRLSPTEYYVTYVTTGPKAMVILNDAILGITDQQGFTLTNLRSDTTNTITLVPLTETRRGNPVSVTLNDVLASSRGFNTGFGAVNSITPPKAPSTGQQ